MVSKTLENRKLIWEKYLRYGGQHHRIVEHMFVDYNRYFEAHYILDAISQIQPIEGIKVLDYGCGVGDYGMTFARKGAKVDFYDFPRATKLVEFRLRYENKWAGLDGNPISADHNPHPNMHEYDLIIFGEVLEHLKNPLKLLIASIGAPFIFTSSYPYRSDDPDNSYWNNPDHSREALAQQADCRGLLERNYDYIRFDGELRLWFKK